MAEQPVPVEQREEPTRTASATVGQVVRSPVRHARALGPEAAARRAAGRAARHHPAAPAHLAGHQPRRLKLALPARATITPLYHAGQVAQAARPHRRVGRSSASHRIAFAQLGWWWVSRAGVSPARGRRGERVPEDGCSLLQACPRGPPRPRLAFIGAEVTRPGARRRGGDLSIPAGAVAAHRPGLVPCRCWRGSGGPSDKPIVYTAPSSWAPSERLTTKGIVRALGVLGIAEMNKALREEPDKAIVTSTVSIAVTVTAGCARGDLPHGVTAGAGQREARENASGPRRQLGWVSAGIRHKGYPGTRTCTCPTRS